MRFSAAIGVLIETFFDQKEVERMKRVKAACICQALHFMPKEDVGQDYAAQLVREEASNYKASLEKHHTAYKIVEETTQPDGSVILEIIKQYNQCSVGAY